jgi:hypothetical protein
MKKSEYLKYIVTFLITAGLFFTIFYVSKVTTDQKTRTVKLEQDTIALNLLSSEVQFSLLNKTGCSVFQDESVFKSDVQSVGDRLSYLEKTLGGDNADVLNLRKYYSLLEMKDYLLVLEQKERCGITTPYLMFFYSSDCIDCQKQSYALAEIRDEHPELRVYAFDYNLDLPAVQTLKTAYKLDGTLPALIINNKVYMGVQEKESVEKLFPAWKIPAKNVEKK